MKEKYLLDLRCAMFWHFGAKEIRETVGELSEYFDSAAESGLSEEQVIEQYGEAKQFAADLRRKQDPVENRRKCAVIAKIVFLIGIIFVIGMFGTNFSVSGAVAGAVLFGPLFLWVFGGANSILEIAVMTDGKKKSYWKLQAFFAVLYIVFQICTWWLIPGSTATELVRTNPVFFGQSVTYIIYASTVIIACIAMYACHAMQRGNIVMFSIVIQGIALIGSLWIYYDFLRRLDTDNEEIRILLWPYLLGVLVSVCWWFVFGRKAKYGRAD